MEYLKIILLKIKQIDEVQGILDNQKSKVPSLQSLAAMKAKDLTSLGDIPERYKHFWTCIRFLELNHYFSPSF